MFDGSSQSGRIGRVVTAALLALAVLALPVPAQAQSCAPVQILPAPSGTAVFGQVLALAGGVLAVGSPATGEVYTFKHNPTTATYDPDPAPLTIASGSLPALAVDLDATGSTLVVGVGATATTRVYPRNAAGNGWDPPVTLTGATSYPSEFGAAVALEQDLLVVGAPGRSELFVFLRNGGLWTPEASLVPGGLILTDRLGTSVAISGGTVVAGAPGKTFGSFSLSNAGGAEVFVRAVTGGVASWSQQATLRAQAPVSGDQFGYRVALEGDAALVGSPFEDDLGTNYGTVYAFERQGTAWTRRATLDGDAGYGGVLASQGNVAVVGTPALDRISIFRRVSSLRAWNLAGQPTPTGLTPGGLFGFAVAVDHGTIAVGAPLEAPAGAVYLLGATACSIRCSDCKADHDQDDAVSIDDIFSFLDSWYAGCSAF